MATNNEDICLNTVTYFSRVLSQISYYLIVIIAYLRTIILPHHNKEKNRLGYEPLSNSNHAIVFYRYLTIRTRDCNQVVHGSPADEVIFVNEKSNQLNINLGSYNYLGFADNFDPCVEAAVQALYKYGVSTGGTRLQYGTCLLHEELEQLTAEFLGVEDAVVFTMGYATNSLNLPLLLSRECLVISDEKNHASIIWGLRQTEAKVEVFRHNDVGHLEQILQNAIYKGQSKSIYKPWSKILIVVEGLYSMDATIVNLPAIIALKKKYKAYLYVDEAHSIGALGKRGGGIVDYFKCNPKDVDILMGTFTKTFAAAGGYIAGSKELINSLRKSSFASNHDWAMPPVVASQIIQVLKILMSKSRTGEGGRRLEVLAENTRYFRQKLKLMGLAVSGHNDSPVVPILVFYYSKVAAITRILLKENIGIVGIGYPATKECRMRICLSAAHTKKQLDYVLEKLDEVADKVGIRYFNKSTDFDMGAEHKNGTRHS